MATEHSNHYKAELHRGNINYTSDAFRIILMATGFTFNKDTHATLTDVSGSELANGNGYTTNGSLLANVDITSIEDDTNDRSDITWDDVTWTASGGDIGPSPGAVIYDDTTADNTVVGFIDFSGDKTASDGGPFTVSNILVRLT